MISKYLFVGTLITIISFGCSSDKKDPLLFNNDFESAKGWYDVSGIYDQEAHSGLNSIYTDANNIYSKTFKIKFKNISAKPLKGVAFSIWCYAESLPINGKVVASVKNDSIESIMYNSTELENFINEEKKWVKVSGKIDFALHVSDPENEFGFYVWNTGKNKILADDVTIRFLE